MVRWAIDYVARAAALPYATEDNRKHQLITLSLNNLDVHPVKTKRDQLDNYVGWVHACVAKIGQDIRTNPRGFWLKKGKRREDWDPYPWEKVPPLFKRPNNRQTWGQLLETRSQHKDITGESYWHLLTATPGGIVSGVEMIQPDWIECPIFNEEGTEITHWKVVVPGRAGGIKTIDARDVIPDFYPNPRDPKRGMSPLEAYALAHHLDIYLRAYGMKMIRDGASIGQYLKTEQELTPEQIESAEQRLLEKFRTPGRVPVFGKGTDVKGLQLPLRDLDMLRILRPSQDMILAGYGVPKSKFGMMEGEGRANADTADKTYQENAIYPRLTTGDEIINEYIVPRTFPPRLAAQVVYESESPVEADREFELKKAQTVFEGGACTLNTYLHALGLESLGPQGEVYFLPAGIRIVKALEDAIEVAVEPEDDPDNPEQEPEQPEKPVEKALRGARVEIVEAFRKAVGTREQRQLTAGESEIDKLRLENAQLRFLSVQDDIERETKSRIRSLFSKEQKLVIEEIEKIPAHELRFATIEWTSDSTNDIVVTRDVLDTALAETTEAWQKLLKETLEKAVKAGWNLLASEVAGALSFSVFNIQAAEYAAREAGKKVAGIQSATLKEIRAVIRTGIEAGHSIDKISKSLAELYDGFRGSRAETIARTETANAVNYGKYQNARESARRLGMNIRRTWVATLDERVRDSHAEAHGQTVGLNEQYKIGTVAMKHPGDPTAPPAEVINCRCTEVFKDTSL